MIDQLEQDCIIASEAGFAAEAGRTGMFTAMYDQADDRVKPEWRCPNCGESHIDRLTINLDEDGEPLDIVTCETCGATSKLLYWKATGSPKAILLALKIAG